MLIPADDPDLWNQTLELTQLMSVVEKAEIDSPSSESHAVTRSKTPPRQRRSHPGPGTVFPVPTPQSGRSLASAHPTTSHGRIYNSGETPVCA